MLDSGCPKSSRDPWANAKVQETHGPTGETHGRSAGKGLGDSTGQPQAQGHGMSCQREAVQLSSLGVVTIHHLTH